MRRSPIAIPGTFRPLYPLDRGLTVPGGNYAPVIMTMSRAMGE